MSQPLLRVGFSLLGIVCAFVLISVALLGQRVELLLEKVDGMALPIQAIAREGIHCPQPIMEGSNDGRSTRLVN